MTRASASNPVRRGRRTMWLVIVLALIAIGGLIGMLVADAVLDTVFFVLTALPLAVGLWRLRAATNNGRRVIAEES